MIDSIIYHAVSVKRIIPISGGFQHEAAAAVAGATLANLATLLMKSFIRRSATGRYELHELVRQFAAEQSAAQTAHNHYCLTSFSRAEEHLRSAAQRATLAALSAENSTAYPHSRRCAPRRSRQRSSGS
jgi:hypothetical protein